LLERSHLFMKGVRLLLNVDVDQLKELHVYQGNLGLKESSNWRYSSQHPGKEAKTMAHEPRPGRPPRPTCIHPYSSLREATTVERPLSLMLLAHQAGADALGGNQRRPRSQLFFIRIVAECPGTSSW
jgi:hypothetical protein